MTKELEELEELNYNLDLTKTTTYINHYNDIKQALQRLESIDQASPSEALESLDRLEYYHTMSIHDLGCKEHRLEDINTIKQALLKSQEQEKVLEIIKEKGLSLAERDMIKHSENYEQYCIKFGWCYMKNAGSQKTQEEFELLKRWIGNV